MTPIEEHTALVAAVTEMLTTAELATHGPWDHAATSLHMDGSGHYQFRPWPSGPQVFAAYFAKSADAMHIAAHHPAWAIAVHREALERLNRHRPTEAHGYCEGCPGPWRSWLVECLEIAGLRSAYMTKEA